MHSTLQKTLREALWVRICVLPLLIAALVCSYILNWTTLLEALALTLIFYVVFDYQMLRAGYAVSRLRLEPGERVLDEHLVSRPGFFTDFTVLRMTDRRFLIGLSATPRSVDLTDVAELIPTRYPGSDRGLKLRLARSGRVLTFSLKRSLRDQLVADFRALRA